MSIPTRTMVIDARTKLEWINAEIAKWDSVAITHEPVILELKRISTIMADQLDLIDLIQRYAYGDFYPQVLRSLRDMQSDIYKARTYITAMQRENKSDRIIRRLLIDFAKTNGIEVEDLLVNLISDYGCIPYEPVPVINGAAWDSDTLVELAAHFHELGHIVFSQYPAINETLRMGMRNFFRDYARINSQNVVGKDSTASEFIKLAPTYWDENRLSEFFSDIYATYVTGPVFYNLTINEAILSPPSTAFKIDLTDPHPPWGIRMKVSWITIPKQLRADKCVSALQDVYNKHFSHVKIPYDTKILYDYDLLVKLVNLSVSFIEEHIPKTRRFDSSHFASDDSGDSLLGVVSLLYEGLLIKLENVDTYKDWENKTFQRITKYAIDS